MKPAAASSQLQKLSSSIFIVLSCMSYIYICNLINGMSENYLSSILKKIYPNPNPDTYTNQDQSNLGSKAINFLMIKRKDNAPTRTFAFTLNGSF